MPLDPNIHVADPSVIEQNQTGFSIPRWFLIAITGISGFFALTYVPWSVWVTVALLGLTAGVKDTDENTARIKALEAVQQTHALQLQTFNASRFESRLDRIETGVQSLQRDFDRTLGKVRPE
jgi:uncharacterized membrane protein